MKFAKYQANNLIPEWRMKYLDVLLYFYAISNQNSTKKERNS